MKVIDNKYCLENIHKGYHPMNQWFELEEKYYGSDNQLSDEDFNTMVNLREEALEHENEVFQYVRILSHNFPNKSLIYVIFKELFLYLKEGQNIEVNHWELNRIVREFLK